MRRLLTLLISLLIASPVLAQGVATFTYQRGSISIARASISATLPWQNEAPLTLSVDIRPANALYQQEGWMNLSGLQQDSAMMFVFEKAQPASLRKMDYYQPIDVLWVDETGTITSIAPRLILAEQQAALSDPKPSKALLMLAGGTVETQRIALGDKLQGTEFFITPPTMMSVPR